MIISTTKILSLFFCIKAITQPYTSSSVTMTATGTNFWVLLKELVEKWSKSTFVTYTKRPLAATITQKDAISTGSWRMVEDSCEEAGCCSDTPPHHVAAAILSILQDLEQIHTHVSKMDDLCVNSAQKNGAPKAGTYQLTWQVWKYVVKHWKFLVFFLNQTPQGTKANGDAYLWTLWSHLSTIKGSIIRSFWVYFCWRTIFTEGCRALTVITHSLKWDYF